jgi:hypothetical protein
MFLYNPERDMGPYPLAKEKAHWGGSLSGARLSWTDSPRTYLSRKIAVLKSHNTTEQIKQTSTYMLMILSSDA